MLSRTFLIIYAHAQTHPYINLYKGLNLRIEFSMFVIDSWMTAFPFYAYMPLYVIICYRIDCACVYFLEFISTSMLSRGHRCSMELLWPDTMSLVWIDCVFGLHVRVARIITILDQTLRVFYSTIIHALNKFSNSTQSRKICHFPNEFSLHFHAINSRHRLQPYICSGCNLLLHFLPAFWYICFYSLLFKCIENFDF